MSLRQYAIPYKASSLHVTLALENLQGVPDFCLITSSQYLVCYFLPAESLENLRQFPWQAKTILPQGLEQPSAVFANLSGRQYDGPDGIVVVEQLYFHARISEIVGLQCVPVAENKRRKGIKSPVKRLAHPGIESGTALAHDTTFQNDSQSERWAYPDPSKRCNVAEHSTGVPMRALILLDALRS